MTAQAADILHFEGRVLPLLANPLEGLWGEARPRPRFVATTTANWRGYVATWIIEHNRLYLAAVEGLVTVDPGGAPMRGESDFMRERLGATTRSTRPASLTLLFPGAGDRVHAEWFTGQLRLPDGEPVHYVHMGYGSVFERELRIDVDGGVVITSEWVETGDAFRRRVEAAKRQLNQALPAQPDATGWLACPHCHTRFTVADRKRWDGERHKSCGGRISLGGTKAD